MDTQKRKTEVTARLRATTPDGRDVVIDERTSFLRTQYEDGSWSEWVRDMRTFWLGSEKLGVLDTGTLQDRRGVQFTLAPPGIG